MNCKKYEDLISLYIDGLLDSNDLRDLENHISVCDTCKKELEIIQGINNHMTNVESLSLPSNFHEELMRKIEAEDMVIKNKTTAGKRRGFFRVKFASAIAAVLMFSLIIIGVFQDDKGDNITPEFAKTRMMNIPVEDTRLQTKENETWIIETTQYEKYTENIIEEINRLGPELEVIDIRKEEADVPATTIELVLDKSGREYIKSYINKQDETKDFKIQHNKISVEEEIKQTLIIIINQAM